MLASKFDSGCLICGKDLVYATDAVNHQCFLCGKTIETVVSCNAGHFVCDKCHRHDSMDIIEAYLNITESVSPVEITNLLLNLPGITMHGPEHHYIVPGALITAYYNFHKKIKLKKKALRYARARAEKIPGGICGTHGACGAGIGAGIFMSMVTGATSLSVKEYSMSHMMTSAALRSIGENGGPRCCKRSTWLAVSEGIRMMKDRLNTELPAQEKIKCTHFNRNRECKEADCLYYN